MIFDSVMDKAYRFCLWTMRFAVINLLWIMFTIAGLIIFGFMPATAAMFTVMRKWVMGQTDIPIFKTFWEAYRSGFLKTNLIGIILSVSGYILYIDFIFLNRLEANWFSAILGVGLICIAVLYVIILFYIFPVFSHYQIKTFQYFKYAAVIGISHPFHTVGIGAGVITLLFIMFMFPGLIFFLSGSIISFIIMSTAHHVFMKINKKTLLKERAS